MIDEPATPTETSAAAPEPAFSPPPPPEPPAAPVPSRYETERERRNAVLVVAPLVVSVVLLVGALVLYWQAQNANVAQTAQIAALEQRVQALEQRPMPPDITPLSQQVTALDQRLTTLEHKPPPVQTLDEGGQKEIAALSGRIDQIIARQNQLGVQQQNDSAQLTTQVSSLGQQLTAATANSGATAGQIQALQARQLRLARLQEAATALAAGHPVGDIPNAPPALAQFATKPPPTEAALRLSFDAAADNAIRAGLPIPQNAPFLDRMWARVQKSVTIRQGARVVVGDPVNGVLGQSRQRLDAGDLAGAVRALDPLVGPAATAMAGWKQQAQALVDARAALLAAAQG